MIDTVAAMTRAREVARRTAVEAYRPTRPASRQKVFEAVAIREFCNLCLPGGYGSLVDAPLFSTGGTEQAPPYPTGKEGVK